MLSGAGLCFVLGVLGALLPVLPATPFLLLTSYLLLKSSPRLNDRLLKSRLFGPILTDWQVHGGIRKGVRVKAIACVVLAVILTVTLTQRALLPKLIVALLAAIGIYVIVRLPAAVEPPDQPDST